MRPEIEKAKKILESIQLKMHHALDLYQKPRDRDAIKKFFPDLDVALSEVSDVLGDWPDYDSFSDSEKMEYGSFLSEYVKEGLKKVKSKV